MKSILFLLIAAFLSLAHAQDAPSGPPVQVGNADPAGILNKVLSKYKSLETYRSNGTIVSDMGMRSGTKIETTTTFTIKLKKPNLYLITWSQTGAMPQGMAQAGAVWNEGTQPYLYMGMTNAYSKLGDDATALGAATGISGGAAYTIPSLFLPAFADRTFALLRLKNPVIEKTESIAGDDCYVLSGSSNASKKETFWISKSSSLILKYERSFEPPAGGVVLPAISDADLEKSLRAMGQPVTEESKKQMRDMMQSARNALKNGGPDGSSTETQIAISSPDLTESDFHFTPPNGAALKDSLFGPQPGFTKTTSLPNGTSSSYETVDAPVEEVFSATDGDNKFIAYLVKRKGSDVIVSDTLARSNFKVGDTIQFLAQKNSASSKFSSLSFTLLSLGFPAAAPHLSPSSGSSYETVKAPVVKIFSATDGDNKFVAYQVKWKGFDVIVSDPLAHSDFKVGDTIRFLAQKIDVSDSASLNYTLL
jgi:hypothetical protein